MDSCLWKLDEMSFPFPVARVARRYSNSNSVCYSVVYLPTGSSRIMGQTHRGPKEAI